MERECRRTSVTLLIVTNFVYEEANRLLRDVFTIWFYANLDFRSTDCILYDQNPEALALRLARGYDNWLVHSVKNSTDWLRRFMCNYVLIMRQYCLFKEAERAGDSPLQDFINTRFFPYYQMLGKTNSKRTLIRVMEVHYKLPPQVLHQLQS